MCVYVCVYVRLSLSRSGSLAVYLDGGEMPLDGGVQHGTFLMPRLLQVPMHRKVATVYHLHQCTSGNGGKETGVEGPPHTEQNNQEHE